jgi:subtilase family serine protease
LVCAVLVAVCAGSVLAVPARPDLVVTGIAVSQRGVTLSVTAVVRNRGGAVARRSSTVYTIGGARLGARTVAPLRPGAAARASVTLTVPASVKPGSYRLRACVDASLRVAEANERNNCLATTGTIAVADRSPPVFAGLMSAVTCLPGPSGGPTRLSSYRLTWSKATDNATPPEALEYDVYMANTPGGEDFSTPTYTTAAGATAFSTPQLPDDRAYYFVVRSRDRAGNEDRGTVERRGTNLCL